jgi:hypothetical protein
MEPVNGRNACERVLSTKIESYSKTLADIEQVQNEKKPFTLG